jgi:hypothetical protein
MRKRLTALLLSIIVGLTACNRKRDFTANEYDVVSAYVASKFAIHKGEEQPSKIVILNMTSCCDDDHMPDENGRPVTWEQTAESLGQKAPSVQNTTIVGFRRANTHQAALGRAFRFSMEYEIIDPARLDPIFKRNGGSWTAYYKRYPGSQGIATLSRVGFSADGTQALFYVSNHCGGLCGGGSYVVMEKRDGRWMIGTEIEMWIS